MLAGALLRRALQTHGLDAAAACSPLFGLGPALSSLRGFCAPAREPQQHAQASAAEVDKFSALAGDWWDPRGSSGPLHAMNEARVPFIAAAALQERRRWGGFAPYTYAALVGSLARPPGATAARPLTGLSAVDVGCGGGILSEALARLGASVTGIDASPACIAAARAHAETQGMLAAARQIDAEVAQRTAYRQVLAGQLAAEGAAFDLVVASEVIEHVPDPAAFCRDLGALAAPRGAVVVSTLHRTLRSWAVAIVGAERLARVVPPGTHSWAAFVTPDELVGHMERAGFALSRVSGMFLNPLTGRWRLVEDRSVNYIAAFRRRQDRR